MRPNRGSRICLFFLSKIVEVYLCLTDSLDRQTDVNVGLEGAAVVEIGSIDFLYSVYRIGSQTLSVPNRSVNTLIAEMRRVYLKDHLSSIGLCLYFALYDSLCRTQLPFVH